MPSVFAVLSHMRGAERRKALVRNAAPMAALRLGQSPHRKGLPVHDADRRALRRSTTVFAKPGASLALGPRFPPRVTDAFTR